MTSTELAQAAHDIADDARKLAREIDDCGGAHHVARMVAKLAALVEDLADANT